MGTFMGHVIPGSFFLVFGTWWTSQIAYRYARAQARRGLPYRSSVTFPCPGCLRSVPVEAILKVVLCSIGIAGEVVTGFRDGKFVNYGNAQHSVMFLLFGLTGVVDVALHYHRGAPPGIDYAAGALAFTVEGLLFVQHLHGRTPLDRQLHELLYCTIFACAVSVVAEARRRRSAVAALSRAYFTLLQGSWFMQAAVVLYSPLPGAVPWAADDHTQMTMVTVIFAWHCVGVLVYMAAVYGAACACAGGRRGDDGHRGDDDIEMRACGHLGDDEDGSKKLLIAASDDESVVEFSVKSTREAQP